jgi:hypothetical protein
MTPTYATSIIRLVDLAVTIRFKRIRPRLHQRPGEYRYDDPQCWPERLGSRFRVEMAMQLRAVPSGLLWVPPVRTVGRVLRGYYDQEIEAAWHDAAGSAWLDRVFARELV